MLHYVQTEFKDFHYKIIGNCPLQGIHYNGGIIWDCTKSSEAVKPGHFSPQQEDMHEGPIQHWRSRTTV